MAALITKTVDKLFENGGRQTVITTCQIAIDMAVAGVGETQSLYNIAQ